MLYVIIVFIFGPQKCYFGKQNVCVFLIMLQGYYTRSGYVPGPICKYNWTKVWNITDKYNSKIAPEVS